MLQNLMNVITEDSNVRLDQERLKKSIDDVMKVEERVAQVRCKLRVERRKHLFKILRPTFTTRGSKVPYNLFVLNGVAAISGQVRQG